MSNNRIDLNPLIRLKDALEGAQNNTTKMLLKLDKFEARLLELDEKMKPVQASTEKFAKAKANITETLQEVGKTSNISALRVMSNQF